VEEFLMKEVSLAMASLGEGGGKGTVLISLRRIPEALAGGGSANVLVTLQAASGAHVGEGDAAALLARQKAATDLLRALSETTAAKLRDAKPEDAAEVSIDAAFEREEKLGALGSALVATGDLVIDRAAVKQAPKASAAAEEEEEGGGGRRQRSRSRRPRRLPRQSGRGRASGAGGWRRRRPAPPTWRSWWMRRRRAPLPRGRRMTMPGLTLLTWPMKTPRICEGREWRCSLLC
jgi:hypothetical protein